MRRSTLVAVGMWLCAAALIQAQETRVKMADLPDAVKHTVEEQSKGATIRGFTKEVEKGKTYYEAELTVDGHHKDILMDASGAVVEVEERVSMDAVPAAAKAGLEKRAGKGKITSVESITKGGKIVAYEAVVQTGTKKSEIQVDRDGKPTHVD
jgi:hypothetical protein